MDKSNESNLEGWAHPLFLEKITSIAPNIIYIFNQRTQSNEYANRSIGESLGYTTQEIRDMGEALFVNLCHPDDLGKIGPYFGVLRQMADGEVMSLEYRMKHKEGRWVWLLGYDTVFERDDAGEVVRHLGIATDITQQKNAQQQAEAEQAIADSANAELQSFAYSMSHDMKGPSHTLRYLLEELKSQHAGSFDDDAQDLINMSLKTVGRMQDLVDDVLNYTGVIGQETEFADVNLNEILRSVFDDLRGDATSIDAELVADHLPMVKGSEIQLRILFQNLIANALKYYQKGTRPTVSISSEYREWDCMMLLHFKDNGIGIAPEHQQKIFELFQRLHANDRYPGTGLGLTICKRIATRHGGDIKVVSALNEGSTFTVSLKQR